jgi:NAD(P)-dependent dehydrogenase (short-subunit alcohol dehydrogenase family)
MRRILATVLDGRTILVTGASTGIGRTTALFLAANGATVLAGVRDTSVDLGPTVTTIKLDITDDDDVANLRGHDLDGLVNNAGIATTGPLEFMPPEELRHQLEVNVIAQLAVTQACFPALRRNNGRIVNVSSISGRMALPLYGPYAASKYALEAVSDSLRREQQDVEVVLVEPGAIATPIWARGLAAGDALWQAMPPQAHERYGALVARLRKEAERQGTEGASPETVARTIATAFAADRPRTRYVVGTDARLQALLVTALPGRVVDRLLGRALRG